MRHSHSRNHPYYFNNSTNESRWNAPEGTNLEKLAIHIKASGATGHSGTDGGGAPQDGKVRAAHLLVKHRDSRRPSSWRDPVITRSKEEARAILEGYEGRIHVGPITLGELAMTESDCSSAKKHGDL